MQTFDSNQCLFCQGMSEECLNDLMQDSKDLELKTKFSECPSSLEVFRIRSLGAHYAMPSKLKHLQKRWSKIIIYSIPEVLYASTIQSSTKLESLKSYISKPSSSAKSTHFSSLSLNEMLASPDSISTLKTNFCIKTTTLLHERFESFKRKKHVNIIQNKIGSIKAAIC